MKQLSGLDASFLYLESPEMPMHVGALHVFELPAGFRGKFVVHLRRHIAARLPLAPVLRRRLWWMPLNLANPAWVDAEPDLNAHIVEVKLPASARQGDGSAEIEAAVGKLHPVLLDRSKPLWKFHVLEGLAPGANGRKRVGLYSQFHHAAVDGQAAVALGQVILDLEPTGRDLAIRPSKREQVTRLGISEMLRGALANEAAQVANIVKSLPATLSTLGGALGQALKGSKLLKGEAVGESVSNLSLAPRTIFNVNVSASRAFASVSLPLAELKAIGKANDLTLNDLVLLLCGTALRRYLATHGGVPRKSLVAAVPISLRARGDTSSNNQASISLVSLGTHLADFRRRLAHVKAATAAMKATMGSVKSVLPTDFPSIGVPWLLAAARTLYGKARVAERIPQVANVAISNVPGPLVPLYMAGARMLSNCPTSIVMHGMALNITVQSYDKSMDFGLMADAQAMPDPRALADALRVAMDDLRALAHPEDVPEPSLIETGQAVAMKVGKRLVGAVSGAVAGAITGALSDALKGAVAGTARRVAAKPRSRKA